MGSMARALRRKQEKLIRDRRRTSPDRLDRGATSRTMKPEKADKGIHGGSCNRRDCQLADSAYFYNLSTKAWYCANCAGLINEGTLRRERLPLVVPESMIEEYEAKWKAVWGRPGYAG